jgi:hypothetical protein
MKYFIVMTQSDFFLSFSKDLFWYNRIKCRQGEEEKVKETFPVPHAGNGNKNSLKWSFKK